MKFSCETALLQNAILTASRAVSSKSTIPALEGLLLEAEETGNVFLTGYNQETGIRSGKSFDELGVLLPIHQFENKMLQHLSVIDGLVLSCREEMIKTAGSDSLDL